ncbi:unnamed protein product [Natator depressus]
MNFNMLPFGLRNAPAIFQKLVDSLLAGLGESAVAYLDYVAIFSDSWAEHLEHLQKVCIRQAGLTVKAKKHQIGLNRVTYLGHQVGQGTINPLQAKVNAIQKWPVPKSKKQVQSFLGLAGYYRQFVPHYSQIAAPLTDLTKKKQPNAVQWTEVSQNAFHQLKATLISDPVLRAPDFDKPFLITTDASERGVGAVLMQEGPDQEFHPVVFLSKKKNCLRGKATGQSAKRNVTPLSTLWRSHAHTFGDGVSTCKPTRLRYSGFVSSRTITKNFFGGV